MSLWWCPQCKTINPNGDYHCPSCRTPMTFATVSSGRLPAPQVTVTVAVSGPQSADSQTKIGGEGSQG